MLTVTQIINHYLKLTYFLSNVLIKPSLKIKFNLSFFVIAFDPKLPQVPKGSSEKI